MAHETSAPARSSFALTAGVVLACFLVFAAIVGVTLYLSNKPLPVEHVEKDEEWKFSAEKRADRLNTLRTAEQAAATTYGWVDQSAGVVRLPIDRAMELVVAEQGRKN